MKPTFALDLTRDVVGLLHRTPKGWLPLGEVAFDAPDLDEALAYLRKTALGLSPLGMATKIVLPNSQILYTEVNAPGPSRDEKRRQIAAALEGRTPYAVDDLVFDWSGKGATVKVAVVARETLEEAEGFATRHRLNPVGFVAIPEDGSFVGEPFFGQTDAAAAILAEGETVEKDREPVSILQRDLPVAPPPARAPAVAETPPMAEVPPVAEEPAVVEEPAPPPAEAAIAADDSPPGPDEARTADLPPAPDLPAAPVPEAEPIAEDLARPAPEPARRPEPTPEPAPEPAPVVEPVAAMPAAPEPATPRVDEVEEAPFAEVADEDAPPAPPPVVPKPSVTAPELEDEIPPAPPSAALMAFASRRSGTQGAAPSSAPPVAAPPRGAEATLRPGAVPPAASRPAPATKGFQGLVTAPTIPGTRSKPKLKPGTEIPRPAMPGPTTVKSPSRPGGTFGAAAPTRGRTGIVFTVLVALLLLFLALIAAWSSYYLAGGDPGATEETAITTADPGIDDEMLADMQDPEGQTAPPAEAAGAAPEADPAAVNLALEEAVPEAAPEAATEAAAAEPAPGTAVATEVATAEAPAEDQDEIFLSAMDAPPAALDALALPAPVDRADAAPAPTMPPPAFGTVYQFDANGLLKPTKEGIVSPDGVFLIAGKPPRLPPSRSETAAALAAAAQPAPAAPAADPAAATAADASLVTAADAAEPAAAPAYADPALAEFRPRPRPETLVPPATGDGAALTPDPAAAAEFAGRRPLPRPETVLAAAAAAKPADLGAQGASLAAQAEANLAAAEALEARNPSIVAISMRPAARPKDFTGAVEAAVAAAVRAPEPQEVAAAAPAPEAKPEELDELNEPETASAAPSIPTKASVAKQATFADAINLSKLNLIGTYGTDSRRYALIRQSNGRYKKVTVGDKIDGGTIKAITETEVRYQKGGRLLSLKLPRA
ncbi:translation initiation factor 2 [Tabrizicola sp.]|uniref:translation initiation factor 2 n=1 Tax=Tabrizicola sp. TaxID=2005166 RepID=UPI0035B156DD